MATLDQFTLVAGSTGGFGFSLTGFRHSGDTNAIGTINGSTSAYTVNSNWYSSSSILRLNRESYSGFTGVVLELNAPGDPGNSGWATMFIDSTGFHRVDASSSTDGTGRTWSWSTSVNPFVSGSSYEVSISDDGNLPMPYALPTTSESISMDQIAEFLSVATTNPVSINDQALRDYLNRSSGAQTSFDEYRHDGYFWRNGNDGATAICAKHSGGNISSSGNTAYAGIDVKFTRRGPGMLTIEIKGETYTNQNDVRQYFNRGGKSYTLSTSTYTKAFDFAGFNSSLTYLAMDWVTDSVDLNPNYGIGANQVLSNNDAIIGSPGNNTFYSTSNGTSIGRTFRSYASATAPDTSSSKGRRWTLRFKIGGYGGTSQQTVALLRIETVADAEYFSMF